MSGLNIKLADLQISDFHAPECCFLWWHTEKTFSFWRCPQTPTRGFAPGPHWGPTAAPRPPASFSSFFTFPPVPCLIHHSGWEPSICFCISCVYQWVCVCVCVCVRMHTCAHKHISRIPDQNGASQAWYIVEMHHSGRKPSICTC